ncbi:MAG: hypothetical protein OEZ68_17215 [Gammaproteobacteria bacterium]|nr:hypothetical protein [Gammaproteobacteria bacterium]MDH5802544.1 hypothetical protein [Gammaproteobacteria bacterium]
MVNTKLWLAIVVVSGLIAYTLGFMMSKHTGVEPGFFEIAESGGYGVSADSNAAAGAGVSEDMQQYYQQLQE